MHQVTDYFKETFGGDSLQYSGEFLVTMLEQASQTGLKITRHKTQFYPFSYG